MRRAAIVCGFPGVGKTTVANATKIAEDIESTPFHWQFFVDTAQEDGKSGAMNTMRVLKEPEEIDGWVSKYVDHINEVSQNTDVPFLLVSCHKAVREEMQMRGIPYIIVAPFKECKDEYIRRYLVRGSDMELIYSISNNWDKYLDELEDDGAPLIHITKNETMFDVFRDLIISGKV